MGQLAAASQGGRAGGHLEEWSVFLVLSPSLDIFNLSQNPALPLKELGDWLKNWIFQKVPLGFSFIFPVFLSFSTPPYRFPCLCCFEEFSHAIPLRQPPFFFLNPLFVAECILGFYYWLWVFWIHVPTIMLSQFVLNFSTGVLGSDGKDLCFSFSQDLHSSDLEADRLSYEL